MPWSWGPMQPTHATRPVPWSGRAGFCEIPQLAPVWAVSQVYVWWRALGELGLLGWIGAGTSVIMVGTYLKQLAHAHTHVSMAVASQTLIHLALADDLTATKRDNTQLGNAWGEPSSSSCCSAALTRLLGRKNLLHAAAGDDVNELQWPVCRLCIKGRVSNVCLGGSVKHSNIDRKLDWTRAVGGGGTSKTSCIPVRLRHRLCAHDSARRPEWRWWHMRTR